MRYSVIIPVFNKANTICESIDSILNQKSKNYEIIVVNDGSTDNLHDVLEKYKNIIRIIDQKNGGVSVARNTGIKNANGDYICFLDADDLWLDNHLKTLDTLIEKYNTFNYFITSNIVTKCNGQHLYSNRSLADLDNDFICDNLLKLLNVYGDFIVNTNCICVKKDFLLDKNLFFEPNIKIGEDTDMWYRISLYTPVVFTKTVTTMYRRENSTATKKTTNTFDWIFSSRAQEILQNKEIKQDIKDSYKLLIDRYNLTCARDYIMLNDKKNAKKRIDLVFNKKSFNYLMTKAFSMLPLSIAHLIYNIKYNKIRS